MSPTLPHNPHQPWYHRLLVRTLQRHAKRDVPNRLRHKYPNVAHTTIAERYIKRQARQAALAGGAAALVVSLITVISWVEVLSAVGIPALVLTLPLALLAFGLEIYYTIRLQLTTAYDLCQLHGVAITPHDTDDLQELFAIGLGVRVGALSGNMLRRVTPAVFRQQARSLLQSEIIGRRVQDWAIRNIARQLARRYLAESLLLKAVVPGVNVLLGAGWNYFSTIGIGQAVQQRTRLRLHIEATVDALPLPPTMPPDLVLSTGFHALIADNQIEEGERIAYHRLVNRLQRLHPDIPLDPDASTTIMEREQWLAALATLEQHDGQQALYAVAVTMIVVNGHIGRAERAMLRQVAALCHVPYDEIQLSEQARTFFVRPAGQTCRTVAGGIAMMLVLVVCGCSLLNMLILLHIVQ